MTVFETLLITHILGDWLLQTEWQALNKRHSWRAMLSHVMEYHVVLLGVLLAKFGLGDARVFVAVGLLAISHAILDRIWPVMWLMRTFKLIVERQPERWLVIAVDQAMHVMLLSLAALYLSR